MSGSDEKSMHHMGEAEETKKEFEEEIDGILKDIKRSKNNIKKSVLISQEEGRGEDMDGDLEQYGRKLEQLKNEVKLLKKIRKHQKKISKLEEERAGVLKEIEKKMEKERKLKRHKKH